MKAITTTILVVAALCAGAPVAGAQNSTPTPQVSPSPSNIDKGVLPTKPSGAEAPRAAAGIHSRIAGNGKYCKTRSVHGTLHCAYASLSDCKKHNKASALRCMANPNNPT
jgi:hypothetical protein